MSIHAASHHAQIVHAAVLEKPPVLDRQHRLHHHRGDLVVLHQLALRPLLRVEQRGHQLRLQFIRRKLGAPTHDLRDLAVFNCDLRRLRRVIRLRPGRDLDPALHQPERPQIRIAVFVGVPRSPQFRRDLLGVDLFAVSYHPRQRINFGRVGEHRRPESLLDDPVVLDIEVGKDDGERHRQHQKRHQRRPQHRIARQPADRLRSAVFPTSLRNSDLNGHSLDSHPDSIQTIPAAKRFEAVSFASSDSLLFQRLSIKKVLSFRRPRTIQNLVIPTRERSEPGGICFPSRPRTRASGTQIPATNIEAVPILYARAPKRKETRSTCGSPKRRDSRNYCVSKGCQAPAAHPTLASGAAREELALTSNPNRLE